MNNGTFLDSNNVFLSGTVVSEPKFSHEIFGEGFYDIMLEVSRLSSQTDTLPLTISERLIKDKQIKTGSSISVAGQFRSYNKLIDGKSKLMLTVFVRDIVENANANPNTIELRGYVCKEPIYRTTPFNREICDVLIAVNRAYCKSDYIPCIAWGRNAKFMSAMPIGQRLMISGRIQSRDYQKKLSENIIETRTAYEVSIAKVCEDDEEIQDTGSSDTCDKSKITYDTID